MCPQSVLAMLCPAYNKATEHKGPERRQWPLKFGGIYMAPQSPQMQKQPGKYYFASTQKYALITIKKWQLNFTLRKNSYSRWPSRTNTHPFYTVKQPWSKYLPCILIDTIYSFIPPAHTF